MKTTKHRKFGQALKNTIVTIGSCLAFSAFSPAVDAKPGSATQVDVMAGQKMKAQVSGMDVFEKFAGEVSGASLKMRQEKPTKESLVRDYLMCRLVDKIRTGSSYKDEAKELGLTITPELAKAIKARFKDLEEQLNSYYLENYNMRLSRGYIVVKPTGVLKPGEKSIPSELTRKASEIIGRRTKTPGAVELTKLASGTFGFNFPLKKLEVTWDQMSSLGNNAQAFVDKSQTAFSLGEQYSWDSDRLKNNPKASQLATEIGNLLETGRGQLENNKAFQDFRRRLQGGDLSALKEMLEKFPELSSINKGFQNNSLGIYVLPYQRIIYSTELGVKWVFKEGQKKFQDIIYNRGDHSYLSFAGLELFLNASYSMHALVAEATRIQLAEKSGETSTISRSRMPGTTESFTTRFGGSFGSRLLGPIQVTLQAVEIGYDRVKIPLKEEFKPLGSKEGLMELTTDYWYIKGLSSIDIEWKGKEGSVVAKLSPRLGIKPSWTKILRGQDDLAVPARTFIIDSQVGWQWETGRNLIRLDVNPKLFLLPMKVKEIVDDAAVEQDKLYPGGGVALNLTYLRQRLKGLFGADASAGLLADYKYLKVSEDGNNRHILTLAVPLGARWNLTDTTSLSLGLTLGGSREFGSLTSEDVTKILAPTDVIDRWIFTILSKAEIKF